MADDRYIWIMTTGDIVPMTREDLELVIMIDETFPEMWIESVKLPGKSRINLHRESRRPQ